jgi:hypothetical protein
MTMTRFRPALTLALCFCALAPACVINSSDDDGGDTGDTGDSDSDPSGPGTTDPNTTDPGTTNPGTTNPGTTNPGTTDPSDSDTDPSDTDPSDTDPSDTDPSDTDPSDTDPSDTDPDTGTDEGSDLPPQDGAWQYSEVGQGTNDCTFLADPSNGFGQYLVSNTGPGEFTITPGDETDPFTCAQAGSSFDCAERLTGTYDIGMGFGEATGNILVAIEGTFASPQEMNAEQQGRIECEGADCGTAEGLLGVTFPCEFTVPFVGDAL